MQAVAGGIVIEAARGNANIFDARGIIQSSARSIVVAHLDADERVSLGPDADDNTPGR